MEWRSNRKEKCGRNIAMAVGTMARRRRIIHERAICLLRECVSVCECDGGGAWRAAVKRNCTTNGALRTATTE